MTKNLPIVWPMKCKQIKTQSELEKLLATKRYQVEEKIKGVRGVIFIQDGRVRITTRGASKEDPSKPIEITHRLPHFELSEKVAKRYDGCIFDCELYTPELDDSQIAGKLNYRSVGNIDDRIKAYVFDILAYCGKSCINESYDIRQSILLGGTGIIAPWMMAPEQPHCPYSGNLDERFIDKIFASGGEGVVLKNRESDYVITEPNFKRVGYWYKYKRKDTIDAMITGAKPPEKYYTDKETGVQDLGRLTKFYEMGWIGSLEYRYEYEGVLHTGYCSGMTDNLRAQLTSSLSKHSLNPDYLGRIIEVEYFEINQYGSLEHPRLKRIREEIEK